MPNINSQVSFEFTGLEDFLDVLKALPDHMAANVNKKAVAKAGAHLRDEMKRRVPVDTGLTKIAMGVFHKKSDKKSAVYGVGPYRRVFAMRASKSRYRKGKKSEGAKKIKRFYVARWLEFGTVKMRPRPFLRPAFDATKNECQRIIAVELGKGLEAEATKLASKFGAHRKQTRRRR